MSPETRIMSPDFFILHVKHKRQIITKRWRYWSIEEPYWCISVGVCEMMAYQTKMLHFVVRISNASGVVAHKYCSSDHVIVFCAIKVFMVLSATNNAWVIKISLLHYQFTLYDLILILVSCDMSLVLGDMTLVSDDTILVSCDIRVSKPASQFFKFWLKNMALGPLGYW